MRKYFKNICRNEVCKQAQRLYVKQIKSGISYNLGIQVSTKCNGIKMYIPVC